MARLVPVVQLSIDETQPPSFHYEIGNRLAQLREEGILILGSGNLVHNPACLRHSRVNSSSVRTIMTRPNVPDLMRILGLRPLPEEGGFFAETYRSWENID